jgi:hypothetical protein
MSFSTNSLTIDKRIDDEDEMTSVDSQSFGELSISSIVSTSISNQTLSSTVNTSEYDLDRLPEFQGNGDDERLLRGVVCEWMEWNGDLLENFFFGNMQHSLAIQAVSATENYELIQKV